MAQRRESHLRVSREDVALGAWVASGRRSAEISGGKLGFAVRLVGLSRAPVVCSASVRPFVLRCAFLLFVLASRDNLRPERMEA